MIPKPDLVPAEEMNDLERQAFTTFESDDFAGVSAERIYLAVLKQDILVILAWWIPESMNVMFFVIDRIDSYRDATLLHSACQTWCNYREMLEITDIRIMMWILQRYTQVTDRIKLWIHQIPVHTIFRFRTHMYPQKLVVENA